MAKKHIVGLKHLLDSYSEEDGDQTKQLLYSTKLTEDEAFEIWDFIPSEIEQGVVYAFLNNPSLTSNFIGYIWNLYIEDAVVITKNFNYILIATETKKVPLSVIKSSFDILLKEEKNKPSLISIVHALHHQGTLDWELKSILLSLPSGIARYAPLIEQVAKDPEVPIEAVVLKAVEGDERCRKAMLARSDDVFAYAKTVSDAFDDVDMPESWMYRVIGWGWMNA